MKDKNEIIETQAKLTTNELEDISWAIEELKLVEESKEVSEEGLKHLQNAIRNISSVQESYFLRLLRILKMGTLLD